MKYFQKSVKKCQKLMFLPKNKGLNYQQFAKLLIFWMLLLMWRQIITHLQLNSVLQEKYKIFPEICEKVSKINVFSPKWRSYSKQITKLLICWMPQLMWFRIITHSQLNRVIQEKYKIFPEICEKMSKIDCFLPKNRQLYSGNDKIIFLCECSCFICT